MENEFGTGTSLVQGVRFILAYWRTILVASLLLAIITAAVNVFLLPRKYESSAVLMSSRNSGSEGGLMRSMFSESNLSSLFTPLKHQDELLRYQTILESHSFVAEMITTNNFLPKLEVVPKGTPLPDPDPRKQAAFINQGIRQIQKYTVIETEPPALTIRFRWSNPKFAKEVASAYVSSLRDFINSSMMTQAKATELFIAEQLKEAEEQLLKIESEYNELRRINGITASDRRRMGQIKIVELLQQNYQVARIESKRDELVFQVIDEPTEPIVSATPKKKVNTAIAFVLGLICSVAGIAFLKHLISHPDLSAEEKIRLKAFWSRLERIESRLAWNRIRQK